MQASTQKCRQTATETDRKQKQHTHKHTHAYTYNSQLIKKPSTLGVCAAECACMSMCVCVCITSSFYYICFQEFSNMPKQLQPQYAFPVFSSHLPLRPLVMTPHEAPESVTCAICCLFTFTSNAFFTAFS